MWLYTCRDESKVATSRKLCGIIGEIVDRGSTRTISAGMRVICQWLFTACIWKKQFKIVYNDATYYYVFSATLVNCGLCKHLYRAVPHFSGSRTRSQTILKSLWTPVMRYDVLSEWMSERGHNIGYIKKVKYKSLIHQIIVKRIFSNIGELLLFRKCVLYSVTFQWLLATYTNLYKHIERWCKRVKYQSQYSLQFWWTVFFVNICIDQCHTSVALGNVHKIINHSEELVHTHQASCCVKWVSGAVSQHRSPGRAPTSATCEQQQQTFHCMRSCTRSLQYSQVVKPTP